mmetsp:Transcript_32767/g.49513  ORF Transcript_32767/g.49513 Transcript_32767/m.49513 type:complete len:115 (-) Transcript_32767:1038-1382(-)
MNFNNGKLNSILICQMKFVTASLTEWLSEHLFHQYSLITLDLFLLNNIESCKVYLVIGRENVSNSFASRIFGNTLKHLSTRMQKGVKVLLAQRKSYKIIKVISICKHSSKDKNT